MTTMRFPTDDELVDCSFWCEPMHIVERAIRGTEFSERFAIEDFMLMGMVVRRGRPNIILSKHSWTRRYLNLDADGNAYRYRTPADDDDLHPGSYVRHRDLATAIRHLRLWEVPTAAELEQMALAADQERAQAVPARRSRGSLRSC